MHNVALVVFDRIPAFEMAVPCEVFGTDRSGAGLPNYRLLVCAAAGGPRRAGGGFSLEAPFGLAEIHRHATRYPHEGARHLYSHKLCHC
jgi:hypothetical protein